MALITFLAGCSEQENKNAGIAGTASTGLYTTSSADTSDKWFGEYYDSIDESEFNDYADAYGLTRKDIINAVDDCVKLKDYKNFTIIISPPSDVTDDDVQEEINNEFSTESTMEEVTNHDKVRDGDWVNIDYTGTIDGKEFDGGSAAGRDIQIGSGKFIDGFEEGLVGHKKGEEIILNLKFADDFREDDLKGKNVTFKVKINSIERKIYPELKDDAVAAAHYTDDNGNEIKTVSALKKYIREKLKKEQQKKYDQKVNAFIREYLLKNNEVNNIPNRLISRIEKELKTRINSEASDYGVKPGDIMKNYGFDDSSKYDEELEKIATKEAKYILIIEAIAKKENIKLSDEEYKKEQEEFAAEIGITNYDKYDYSENNEDEKETDYELAFADYVFKWVKDTVIIVDPTAQPADDLIPLPEKISEN